MAAWFVCHSDIKGRNLTYKKMNLSSEIWEFNTCMLIIEYYRQKVATSTFGFPRQLRSLSNLERSATTLTLGK